mgnify:CR=1 FL=1
MSNYRLVRPSNNNMFYKILTAMSTIGILSIAGIQVSMALKERDISQDQLAQIMVELKNGRKEALAERKIVRAEALKYLNAFKTQTFAELKSASASSLGEVERNQKKILADVKTIRADVLKELRGFECRTLVIE